tara:strand:- start:1415 stop:3871 length:2457 start_codon:yes stop_codon:yes gene_type:complete
MRIIDIIKFSPVLILSFLYSVFAPNYTYNMIQPNGYTFQVRMHGSEYYNYIETIDGYTVSSAKIDEKLWWYYANKEDGKIVPSDILVSKENMPPSYSFNLKPDYKYKDIVPNHLDTRYKENNRNGIIKPLVILVDFSDNSPVDNHQYSKEQFASILFEDNLFLSSSDIPSSYNMSVKDYYNEVSDGEIIIEGDINSVVDWVTVPENYSYYVDGNQGLGLGDGGIHRSAKATLVHAMELIDLDITEFDGNNDGVCDLVIMIMEGSDSGSLNEFWSFKSSLWYGEASEINPSSPVNSNNELVYNGIVIRNFIVTTETIYHSDGQNYDSGDIRPIGTICHEIGHLLGLPDLYDTSESSAPGIGHWGLMGAGNWNNQVSPSLFCPWSSAKLEIIDLVTLNAMDLDDINIEPIHDSRVAYKINIGADKLGEYLLLENRSAVGVDSYLKGEGLLIWHIDERLTSTFPFYNEVNVHKDFYGVKLLEAGGTNHLSAENGSVYSSESHVFNEFTPLINDYSNPSLMGNSYDKDADGIRESRKLSGIEIENILIDGDNINLSISSLETKGERMVYNESGVHGCLNPYSLNYNPGVKYYSSLDQDEYLKAIQVPIINEFGSVDSVEITVYDILDSPTLNENNIIYSIVHEISWGCSRENGIVDLYINNLQLNKGGEYFIQFIYHGEGNILPVEFPFFIDISPSGLSYKNINGNLIQISNMDFAITVITSVYPNHEGNEEESCHDIQIKYPYPNPSNKQIIVPYSENLLENISIQVYNLLGENVIERNIDKSNFPKEYPISLSNLPSGVYFILVSDASGIKEKYKISIIN